MIRIINENSTNILIVKEIKNILYSIDSDINELNINGLTGIEIINDSNFYSDSDGKFIGDRIVFPKDKTLNYIKNNMISIIKSTLYHELCHVDLFNKYPKLHSLHSISCKKDDDIVAFTIMIFIEYLAHLKSNKYETTITQKKFFDSINQKKWDFNNEDDLIIFIKYSAYIIARNEKDKNIDNIVNFDDCELKSRLLEIKKAFDIIMKKEILDDYNILIDLEKIVKKYITNE